MTTPAGTTTTTSTSPTTTDRAPCTTVEGQPVFDADPGRHPAARRPIRWRRDTFTNDAPVGSFAQGYVANASYLTPIYTGDHGMGWSVYPDGWPSSYTASTVAAYQPSTVLSVHDGVLDFYLHDDANGNPVGADLSPWPGGNEYQTYGAYSLCEKVTPPSQLTDFYEASLLWPQNFTDGECAESDFPETYSSLNGGSLDSGEIYAFAHYGAWSAQSGCPSTTRSQGSWNTPIDLSQWHVFTQEWGPATLRPHRRTARLHHHHSGVVTARALADSDGAIPVVAGPERARRYRPCLHLLGMDRQGRLVTEGVCAGRRHCTGALRPTATAAYPRRDTNPRSPA